MVNRKGRIVVANAPMEEMFGYSKGEVTRLAIEDLIPQRFREHHPAYRSAFFAGPQGRDGRRQQLVGIAEDGAEFPVEVGLWPLETEDGLFVLASIIDISTRKQAEEQSRGLNATLEQRVAERTAAVHESEERIMASLREKEVLLKEIHHRVKNNLQIVCPLLDLQSDHPTDRAALAMFKESQGRVRSMALIHERLYCSEDFGA